MLQIDFWDGPANGSSANYGYRYGGGPAFAADSGAAWFVTPHWDRSPLARVRCGRRRIHCEMEENPEFIIVRDGRWLMIGTGGLSLKVVYLAI